jgi:hypothetical protein
VGVAATNFYSPRNETDLSSFDLGRNLFAEDGCDWSSGGPDLLEAEEEEFHFNQDGGDHRLSPTETRTLVGLDDESLIRLALGDCGRGDGEERKLYNKINI